MGKLRARVVWIPWIAQACRTFPHIFAPRQLRLGKSDFTSECEGKKSCRRTHWTCERRTGIIIKYIHIDATRGYRKQITREAELMICFSRRVFPSPLCRRFSFDRIFAQCQVSCIPLRRRVISEIDERVARWGLRGFYECSWRWR